MEIKLSRNEVKDILMEHVSKTMTVPKKSLSLMELVPLREVTFIVREVKPNEKSAA
jgi:hypothetical protein